MCVYVCVCVCACVRPPRVSNNMDRICGTTDAELSAFSCEQVLVWVQVLVLLGILGRSTGARERQEHLTSGSPAQRVT